MAGPIEPSPKTGSTVYQDPTALTTAAVDRATKSITESIDKDIKALKELTHTEFTTRDVAVRLLADDVKLISVKIQQEVAAQSLLLVEKQNVIKADMAGMKELATALKSAADAGINAAFLAADKVVQSQYTAFKDTLDKTNDSIVLRIIGIERQQEISRDESRLQMSDLKDRITRLETVKTERHSFFSDNISLITILVLVATLAITFIEMNRGSGSPPATPAAIAVAPLSPNALQK